ncbi:hypothetical protein TWF730_010209 [Orbilia blumenaviensis]|uniref:F-box domain-containing protein n=1 Tax=Orbilia blumenaviensis TaxID=1796055 RepID=A0AAV9UMJ5_9PEZI
MSITTLPNETLLEIFDYLSKGDLAHVVLVQRRWMQIGTICLCKELEVRMKGTTSTCSPALMGIEACSPHVRFLKLRVFNDSYQRGVALPTDHIWSINQHLQLFSHVKSFAYDDRGHAGTSLSSVLWKVVKHSIVSMVNLLSLEILHKIDSGAQGIYPEEDTIPPLKHRLKDIRITLRTYSGHTHDINAFFKRLFKTVENAENLVSSVDLDILAQGRSLVDRSRWNYKLRALQSVILNRVKHYSPANLISADFSKLTSLSLTTGSFEVLITQIEARAQGGSCLSPDDFNNLEVLCVMPSFESSWRMYRYYLDTKVLPQVARWFPKIREIRIECLDIGIFPISHNGDGTLVVGTPYTSVGLDLEHTPHTG